MEEQLKKLFGLDDYELTPVEAHYGGRNKAYICALNGERKYVLRVSDIGDRTAEDYLAEAELVRYLARGGAGVADVVCSRDASPVTELSLDGRTAFVTLFEYARGELIADHGYSYIEGVPLREYFRRTGETLGKIHALSKKFSPEHERADYFDRFNAAYIDTLIPDTYSTLKVRINELLDAFAALPRSAEDYGTVHFDFSDGNYHIDYDTGKITAFDFDNSCRCFYMYDLANLWLHGEGWMRGAATTEERERVMGEYFDAILEGYRSETELSAAMLERLPLFIYMVLIENIVDEFECCKRAGDEVDCEDIEDAVNALLSDDPIACIIG